MFPASAMGVAFWRTQSMQVHGLYRCYSWSRQCDLAFAIAMQIVFRLSLVLEDGHDTKLVVTRLTGGGCRSIHVTGTEVGNP